MKVVLQKAKNASCKVGGKIIGTCPFGLVILVAFHEKDREETLQWMAKKIVNLRIFEDENGVMNRSLLEVKGTILSISQFTLYGDCKKGNRPSYIEALNSKEAKELYNQFNKMLKEFVQTEEGAFGENMEIQLTNIGPTTIFLER